MEGPLRDGEATVRYHCDPFCCSERQHRTRTHIGVFKDHQQQRGGLVRECKQVATAVASGQLAWGLTDTDDAIIEKDHGEPITIIYPDQQPDQPGTLRIPNTLAILKNAPHPVAAEKIANYLTEPNTEERLAMGNSSQIPLNPESDYKPRVLPNHPVRWMAVDFEAAGNNWESWSAEVQDLSRLIFDTRLGYLGNDPIINSSRSKVLDGEQEVLSFRLRNCDQPSG